MVEHPVAQVRVPLPEAEPVPVATKTVSLDNVPTTVKVCPLFVYVHPAVALAEEIVNTYAAVDPVEVLLVNPGAVIVTPAGSEQAPQIDPFAQAYKPDGLGLGMG